MLDKDKLFLVVYFGTSDITNRAYGNAAMSGLYEKLKSTLDDSVKVYLIPQRTTAEVKMEILNVKDVSEDKINELEKIYQEVLDEFKKSV